MAFLGKYDWEDWIRGLIGAFIGGFTGAWSSGFIAAGVDPTKTFQLGSGPSIKLMVGMCVFSGANSFFATLNKKTLPDKVIEKTKETTKIGGQPVEIKEIVKETSKEITQEKKG